MTDVDSKNFYITTPIYYVNDAPHIGHAYTSLASDVIARFMYLSGYDVYFLTGTDEHGRKIAESAKKKNFDNTQDFVDLNAQKFKDILQKMNISYDQFIRTTQIEHKNGVQHIWNILLEKGDIYLGKYSGWYSVRDEAFYADSEINNGVAPTGAPVEWVEEESYFFALSKWQDKLLEFYESNPSFIQPKSRYNEVVSFVKSGLEDLSISRLSVEWGIKVPNNESHTIYVWLDALTNYISALGYPDVSNDKYKKYWPANLHIVGKDILRFHAVYWPAFLMAASLPLPEKIFAHGWWTNENQKISKSLGNIIDPFKLLEEFNVDSLRYFMMREISFGEDGNYSRQNFIARNNNELVNKIGNLLQRVSSFVFRNCDQAIPNIDQDDIKNVIYKHDIINKILNVQKTHLNYMKDCRINKVIIDILGIVDDLNAYFDHSAPWKLKNNKKELNHITYLVMEATRLLAIMLQPFIPESAEAMLDQLSVEKDQRNFINIDMKYALKSLKPIKTPQPIFKKFE